MSEFADAFDELLDANDEVCGKTQFILLDGRKLRAIIEEIATDDMIMPGGVGESSQFRVQVASAQFADQPERGAKVQVRGRELDLLSVADVNDAVFMLTVGDLAAEDV